jgi:hypothetical protein
LGKGTLRRCARVGAYQERIYQKVLKSSIEQVTQEENLTYEEVESLFMMLSKSANYKEWADRKRLSIDEISKRKGHKNFITKEEFREIYETSSTVKSGLRRIKKWLAQAKILYGKVTETIRTHLQGICNYFISHITSGARSGINNKAKLIIRQGYGFSNFEHLRLRLLASFSD